MNYVKLFLLLIFLILEETRQRHLHFNVFTAISSPAQKKQFCEFFQTLDGSKYIEV